VNSVVYIVAAVCSEQKSTCSKSTVECCPSYSQLEGHTFGRQSFGGFNPLVEQNVKSGLWRPFHLDPFEEGRPEEDDNELSDLED
jgi:hypothetical protein